MVFPAAVNELVVREIAEIDAQDFLTLCQTLDKETEFMMLEPGERMMSVEEQRIRIQEALFHVNQTILVAEYDGRLVGYVAALGGHWERNRHTATLIIGILQGYTGIGLGTRLMNAVEAWARQKGLHRLELTVMTHNEVALSLYDKMGYGIEGTKRDSLCIDGEFVDEYYMAKLLN